jgi:hypothetical protein
MLNEHWFNTSLFKQKFSKNSGSPFMGCLRNREKLITLQEANLLCTHLLIVDWDLVTLGHFDHIN